MNKFEEIIDTYLLNYSTYKNGKVVFDYEYGELIFFKQNPKIITIFSIYIYPEYRQQGLCRGILQYLIKKCLKKFNYLCIEAVLSKILYEYLGRFEYANRKFKNKKDGWFFKLF
jgi:hypothetical protein